MDGTATRLTLYALLSALEGDLRSMAIQNLDCSPSSADLLPAEVHERAMARAQQDDALLGSSPRLSELLDYVDLGDLLGMLNAHREQLPSPLGRHLRKVTSRIQSAIPIRNRVMHMRPLHVRDFSIVVDLAKSLASRKDETWRQVSAMIGRLEVDPGYVLNLRIPTWDFREKVSHNLPIPDFDETGFIGREEVASRLLAHCQGPYPVITIVGEGGIGKTALALKVAYDLLDLPHCPFSCIIWSSSRTMQLTPSQVRQIDGAISDSLGLIDAIAHELGGPSIGDPFEEVLEYLNTFKILLVLDNLETILDDRVHTLLERLAGQSKILITSRIGLGAFEVPVKLLPLENGEAVQLLRYSAQARGAGDLVKTGKEQLGQYCQKMQNNPGFIKWFVSAVQTGQRPEQILRDPSLFLDFCMSNVFGYLGERARQVVTSLRVLPQHNTLAELAYLNEDMTTVDLQGALQDLLRTNMVLMTSTPTESSYESKYNLSDLAERYLDMHHPVDPVVAKKLVFRHRQLTSAGESTAAERHTNPYSYRAIATRSLNDRIVAKYLLDAVNCVLTSDSGRIGEKLDAASERIDEAMRLAPEFFEVHRVSALVHVCKGNFMAARAAYETALDMAPDSPQLHFWYGSFLLRHLDDTEGALVELRRAGELDPDSYEVQTETARVLLYLQKFPETRNMLDTLLSRSDLPQRAQIKTWDLHLQYYARRADASVLHYDYDEALRSLRELRSQYEACPRRLRDYKMTRRLDKALPTASACADHLEDDRSRAEAQSIVDWICITSTI